MVPHVCGTIRHEQGTARGNIAEVTQPTQRNIPPLRRYYQKPVVSVPARGRLLAPPFARVSLGRIARPFG